MTRLLYTRAAEDEGENGSVPVVIGDSGPPRYRCGRFALITLLIGVAVYLVYDRVSRYWRSDTNIWPFHSLELADTKILQRGKFGNVYGLNLTEEFLIYKTNPAPGESKYAFETILGLPKLSSDPTILALYRLKAWWIKPSFVNQLDELPLETLFLLGKDYYRRKEFYRLVMTVIVPFDGGYTSASFKPSIATADNTTYLALTSETGGMVGLYSGVGDDPFLLVQEGIEMAVQMASGNDGTTKVSTEKKPATKLNRLPRFAQRLGWCTWNAFYTDITGHKLLSSLQWLKSEQKIPIGWMIIDDGWQSITHRLNSRHHEALADFGADRSKFNSSSASMTLEETVSRLKSGAVGVESVFAWHAFSGYWGGIDPHPSTREGNYSIPPLLRLPSSSLYNAEFSEGIIHNDPGQDWGVSRAVAEPDKISEFYDDYHSYMRSIGLDGVKVDVQGFTGSLKPQNREPSYQHMHFLSTRMSLGLARSVSSNFGDDHIIHCMCHAPELFFRVPNLYEKAPLMRASDEFYPDQPSSHGPMITALAFNSLLLGQLAIPDWDMFQTILPDTEAVSGSQVAKAHAVARAISGGPIYVSDGPGKSNPELLKNVVCSDGTVLAARNVGLPTRKSLLSDPLDATQAPPLIIQNTNGIPDGDVTSGILGIFNLVSSSKKLYNPIGIRPNNIEGFRTGFDSTAFLIFSYNSKQAQILRHPQDELQLEIPASKLLWTDVLTIIPITQLKQKHSKLAYDFIPLGILGKYNGAGAVVRVDTLDTPNTTTIDDDVRVRLSVRGCGEFGTLLRLGDNFKNLFRIQVDLDKIILPHGEIPLRFEEETPIYGLMNQGFVLVLFDLPSDPLTRERWVTFKLTSY